MGRLATHIAAKATHADNLPTKLPNVSLIDALLPRKVSSFGEDAKMPIDPNKSAPPSVIYTDVKKGKDGKLLMVRHKSSSIPGTPASVKEEAPKDAFKKDDGKKEEEKKDDKAGDKPEIEWTADEDAKLKELKTANTSWKNIAQEMGKPQGALKARWKEIEGKAEEPKKDEATEKKAEPAASGEFTAADDEKIKELLASNTGFKKIAQELGRPLDKALKDHINELKKAASEGEKKKEESAPEKKDAEEKSGDFTAEDDAKIKDLLAANTPYKQIATDLGRKLDKDLKDRIKKLKDEGGGEKKEGAPKEEKKPSSEKASSEKKEKTRDEPKPASRAPSAKVPSLTPSRHSSRSTNDPRFTPSEWRTLSEDEMFSFGELQLLIKLVSKDPDHNWLHIASAFMDKTGRRVHPEDIREKFMEVGIV